MEKPGTRTSILLAAGIISALAVGLALAGDGDSVGCDSCNVVYISVEPLNAERMSLYGNERNTTPNIDRLAEDSYVFHRAFAQSSHTKPSLYSTFSSSYVSQHGFVPGEEPETDRVMLPELMKQKGFRTISLRESKLGQPLSDGFEEEAFANRTEWDSQYRYLERKIEGSDDRFFLFYQSFMPHDPYLLNDNLTEMYGPQLPEFRNETRETYLEMREESERGEFYPRYREYYFSHAERNETKKRFIVSQYDASVKRTDMFIGRIIELLKEKGEYDNTIIIVNSQHGEQFGSHGHWWHDTSLYNEVIRVPLVVHMPGQEKRRDVYSYVENLDLAPTIVELSTGKEPDIESWEGISLVPLLEGKNISKEFVLAERGGKETAFIDIESGIKYYNSTTGEEFYDLREDFEEENPVGDRPEIREKFKAIYEDLRSKSVDIGGTWPYFRQDTDG